MCSGSCQVRGESADHRNLGRHQYVRTSKKTWHRGHIFVEQFALALLDKFYISHAIHKPTAAVLIGAVATQMWHLLWAITNVTEEYWVLENAVIILQGLGCIFSSHPYHFINSKPQIQSSVEKTHTLATAVMKRINDCKEWRPFH